MGVWPGDQWVCGQVTNGVGGVWPGNMGRVWLGDKWGGRGVAR